MGSNSWQNNNLQTLTRDNFHNILSDYYYSWNTGTRTWTPDNHSGFTYDSNGVVLTDTAAAWNSGQNALVNQTLTVYTNDTAGNHLTTTNYHWANGWNYTSRTTSTYDAGNNNTQALIQNWDSAGVTWLNYQNTYYYYDGNHNDTAYYQSIWNSANSTWFPDLISEETYVDGNKVLSQVFQNRTLQDSVWAFSTEFIYTYDAGFNVLSWALNDYNGANWYGVSYYQNTYDVNENLIYQLNQVINQNTHLLENSQQIFLYYTQINVTPTAIAETKNQLNTCLYPNPSTGTNVQLLTNMEAAANVRVSLYDLNGRLVTTQMQQFNAGQNTTQLNYNIGSGTYFIQVLDYSSGKSSILSMVRQ